MGSKRITREDLNRLKKKRRQKINAMVALGVSACLIIIVGVSILLLGDRPSDAEYGAQLNIGDRSDFGKSDTPLPTVAELLGTNTDADTDNKADKDNVSTGTDVVDSEGDTTEELSFEVPQTSLPPIAEIEGNNWCPEGYVKSSKIVPLSYFDNTVLIGDSRTEGILLYSGLPNLNGFCYKGLNVGSLDSDACISIPGYGGKYTCYQAVSLVPYDNYYCMFGINELGWYDLGIFIDKFSELVDHIKSVNPDATIYVEGVIPVCLSKEQEGDGIFTKAKVEEFNALLLEMCKKRNDCIFLDVGASVRDANGYLPEEGSPDGVHCNADYCKRVLEYIRENVYIKQ